MTDLTDQTERAQLTKPAEQRPPKEPARRVKKRPAALSTVEFLRFGWTQLTSMRTALALLFIGALATIPGSLVPQSQTSPVRVSDFVKQHPRLGSVYDKIGMFHVYTSPWFSAIYLLLFISLIGCILPRVAVYARAVRATPPKTPRNLSRLPGYTSGSLDTQEPQLVLAGAAEHLRKRHFRVVERDGSLSAERGYLREGGNLVFHISLLFLLLGVAIGVLGGYRGTSLVIAGQGFSNNLTQYDDITAGAAFSDTDLKPFTVIVDHFEAKFETGPVQRGAARVFRANVRVIDHPGDAPRTKLLEVNKPLTVDGTTVHLIGHGYAPKVTIRDGNGKVAFSGPVPFLPQDGNFTSAGAIKAPDARPDRLAFEGFFLPTAVVDDQGPRSVFPDAFSPALFLNAWYGPPKKETGQPESVYSLNTDGLTKFTNASGNDSLRFQLTPGAVRQLPDGKGSITMDGWTRWVKLQVSDTPGMPITLGAVGFAVLGLCLSLFIRPRRIWVRARKAEGTTGSGGGGSGDGGSLAGGSGSTVVEIGGLDRADARTGLSEDVQELASALGLPESKSEKVRT